MARQFEFDMDGSLHERVLRTLEHRQLWDSTMTGEPSSGWGWLARLFGYLYLRFLVFRRKVLLPILLLFLLVCWKLCRLCRWKLAKLCIGLPYVMVGVFEFSLFCVCYLNLVFIQTTWNQILEGFVAYKHYRPLLNRYIKLSNLSVCMYRSENLYSAYWLWLVSSLKVSLGDQGFHMDLKLLIWCYFWNIYELFFFIIFGGLRGRAVVFLSHEFTDAI